MHGIHYEFTCFPGTHWNPAHKGCDWPANVHCSSGPSGLEFEGDQQAISRVYCAGPAPNASDISGWPAKFLEKTSATTSGTTSGGFGHGFLVFGGFTVSVGLGKV